MTEKNNDAKKNNVNTTDKLAELKRRQRQHDVTISIDGETKTIKEKEWLSMFESADAKLFPKKISDSVTAAISAYWFAQIADVYTKQYGSSNEAHFGFTMRPIAIVSEIKEIYDVIDNMIFFAATNGDNEKFDCSRLIKALIGDEMNCLVSVQDMETLNWMFKRLQFFCADLIRDNGYNSIPEYYQVEMLGEVGVKSWFVPAEYVKSFFESDDAEVIIVEDDGLKICFSKGAPTTEQISCESDEYSVVSIHDAFKRIMIDYFYSMSEN